MRIELTWWNLTHSDPNIEHLYASLTDIVLQQWQDIPNLSKKLWLVTKTPPKWGALMIWDGDKPNIEQLPPNYSEEALGRPPDQKITFDVL